MIQINNLVKKFDDFTALDGVNMNVEKGELSMGLWAQTEPANLHLSGILQE